MSATTPHAVAHEHVPEDLYGTHLRAAYERGLEPTDHHIDFLLARWQDAVGDNVRRQDAFEKMEEYVDVLMAAHNVGYPVNWDRHVRPLADKGQYCDVMVGAYTKYKLLPSPVHWTVETNSGLYVRQDEMMCAAWEHPDFPFSTDHFNWITIEDQWTDCQTVAARKSYWTPTFDELAATFHRVSTYMAVIESQDRVPSYTQLQSYANMLRAGLPKLQTDLLHADISDICQLAYGRGMKPHYDRHVTLDIRTDAAMLAAMYEAGLKPMARHGESSDARTVEVKVKYFRLRHAVAVIARHWTEYNYQPGGAGAATAKQHFDDQIAQSPVYSKDQ